MASTNLTPQQVAAEVLEVIPNYRRWLHGTEMTPDHARHCVLGAVKYAGTLSEDAEEFSDRFWETARSLFPGRYNDEIVGNCPSWEYVIVAINDHEATTYADIRVILEKIAAG
jgi:hypothetical protein